MSAGGGSSAMTVVARKLDLFCFAAASDLDLGLKFSRKLFLWPDGVVGEEMSSMS